MIPEAYQRQQLYRLLLLFILLLVGLVVLLFLHVGARAAGTGIPAPTDCALVFGAAVRSQHSAGPGIDRRVRKAVSLYQKGFVRRLLFTGGKGSPTQESEAAVMRTLALRLGVDPEDVATEDRSRSTWENLQNSRSIAENCTGKVIAVSDRYHLARIEIFAKEQGWGTLLTAPADAPPQTRFEILAMVRESFAILIYRARELPFIGNEFDRLLDAYTAEASEPGR